MGGGGGHDHSGTGGGGGGGGGDGGEDDDNDNDNDDSNGNLENISWYKGISNKSLTRFMITATAAIENYCFLCLLVFKNANVRCWLQPYYFFSVLPVLLVV